MGTEVIAHCECGLDATIMIGAGFADFPHVCLFPAFCEKCRQVVQANLAKDPARCPECRSTDIFLTTSRRYLKATALRRSPAGAITFSLMHIINAPLAGT